MKKEIKINSQAEAVASHVSDILSKNNNRNIDYNLVYQCTKEVVDDKNILDEVYNSAISILENKYGVLFDVDKKIEI